MSTALKLPSRPIASRHPTRMGARRPRPAVHPWAEQLEDRVLLSAVVEIPPGLPDIAHAPPQLGTIAPGESDFFAIVLTDSANLSAMLDVSGPVSLTLYDHLGVPIVRSDGEAVDSHLFRHIVHGLIADGGGTTYYLKAANLGEVGSGDVSYELSIELTPSDSTLQTVPLDVGMSATTSADFNGDGHLDIAIANLTSDVTVLLGNGDGTFQKSALMEVGAEPTAIVAGDFDGDGVLDLATINFGTSNLSILFGVKNISTGLGTGTFGTFKTFAGAKGTSLAAADFDGDHRLDLAIVDSNLGNVSILRNIDVSAAGGRFQITQTINVAGNPSALVAADLNGDHRADLALACRNTNQVTILMNNGSGTFPSSGASFDVGTGAVGIGPVTLTVGDFNEDGHLDLATGNIHSSDVSILLGDGTGSFDDPTTMSLGSRRAGSLISVDVDGDHHLDLVTANPFANDLTVIRGNGDGTFLVDGSYTSGALPVALIAGDFDEDGRVDLAAANQYDATVVVLLGSGDGAFTDLGSANATGHHPLDLVQGDFNGDGQLDLASVNDDFSDLTVLLGQGDGTFTGAGTYPVGARPKALVAGDFNGDGRLDLVTANALSMNLTLLLGNGDGSFKDGVSIDLGGRPSALVTADFDNDGNLDLAATLDRDNVVVVLRGDGHGSFAAPQSHTVGSTPVALVVGYFDNDDILDLATANYSYTDNVSVLLGTGDGGFDTAVTYSTPIYARAVSLVAGDFDGDTTTDLAVAVAYYPGEPVSLAILANVDDGTFEAGPTIELESWAHSLVAGDFDGDGRLDLATADKVTFGYAPASTVTVLLSDGTDGFKTPSVYHVESQPTGLISGDLNGDGRLDLAAANWSAATVTALIGVGTGNFVSHSLSSASVQSTPMVGNFTSDEFCDAIVLTASGQILFRSGLADQPGAFGSPIVLNPDPQAAARDIALVHTADGLVVASLNAHSFAVTLYRLQPDDTFAAGVAANLDLPVGLLPANIAAGDLNGDGYDDLVVTAASSDKVYVALQTVAGGFGHATEKFGGVNISAISLVRVNDDSYTDIVLTDSYSGQVLVLLNDGAGDFNDPEQFRAGTGLYGLASLNGSVVVHSMENTIGFTTGDFNSDDQLDIVTLNNATHNFALLAGNSIGGFLNPQASLEPLASQTISTGVMPTAIVSADFDGDSELDIAVLNKNDGTVTIYLGSGDGNFTFKSTVIVGNQPTGIAVADVSSTGGGAPDGTLDLLVGNTFGDLLILAGNGDGTFSQYRRADRKVSLVVAPGIDAGAAGFFFSDTANDRLSFRSAAAGARIVDNPDTFEDRDDGIQAPGPQAIVAVQGKQYLVVANSGANEVLIYTIGVDGRPESDSRQRYFAGTDPVSLAITGLANDLNGDDIPDVVAVNQGSNDVSIYLGEITHGTWSLTYRPRQNTGGVGPTSVAIKDVSGLDGPDGFAELFVSNGQSNNVGVLSNRGEGFFVTETRSFATGGANPNQVFVENFDHEGGFDLVTVNAGSSDVTLIRNFLIAASPPILVSTGGDSPSSAIVGEINGAYVLFIANTDNGALDELRAGPDGFEIRTTFNHAVPHLSDLALVFSGDQLHIYGTEANHEIAVLIASFLPPVPGFPTGLDNLTEIPTTTNQTNVGLTNQQTPGTTNTAETTETSPGGLGITNLITTTLQLLFTGTDPNTIPVENDPTNVRLPSPTTAGANDGPNSSTSGSVLNNLPRPDDGPPANMMNEPAEPVKQDDGAMLNAERDMSREADFSAHFWQNLATRASTPSVETSAPVFAYPGEPDMPAVLIEMQPSSRTPQAAVVIAMEPHANSLSSVEEPPRRPFPESQSPPSAATAGVWLMLPLVVSNLLEPFRERWTDLTLRLRRIVNRS